MSARLDASLAALDRGEFLTLDRPRGRTVAVCSGEVWLTQEGDDRDVFLQANERAVLARRGTVLIQALTPTQLVVLEPSRVHWSARLLACFARLAQPTRTALAARMS